MRRDRGAQTVRVQLVAAGGDDDEGVPAGIERGQRRRDVALDDLDAREIVMGSRTLRDRR